MAKKTERLLIGRSDRVDFPKLDLFDLSCKVDTGAFTSSIHCHHVQLVERDGKDLIRFELLNPEHVLYNNRKFEVSDFTQKSVKNSGGVAETRFVIHSEIILFGRLCPIELTLADRVRMRFPLLLGRSFLSKNRILVDVNKYNLSHKSKCKMLLEMAKDKDKS